MNVKEFEERLTKLEKNKKDVAELTRNLEAVDRARISANEELAEAIKEITMLEKEVKASAALREFVDARYEFLHRSAISTGATSTIDLEKELRKILGLEEGAEITLEKVKKIIKVKKVKQALPTVDTTTIEGKILQLVVDGKLERAKRPGEILEQLPGLSKIEVNLKLTDLAGRGLLLKKQLDATHVGYSRHPDVEVLQVQEH